jgi:hypothetical protein
MDDVNDLVAGLKSDVDSHAAAASQPQTDPHEDLISGLKADVDKTIGSAPAPAKNPMVANLGNMPFANKVMYYESGGDPNAHASGTSASGSGQFINGTWIPLVRKNRPDLANKSNAEILEMRSDPELSRQMIDAYGKENASKLQQNGIPVSDATKYGSHWFGPDAYMKMHNADPAAPIESIIGDAAAANNGLKGKTVGDVKTLTQARMGPDVKPQEAPKDWGDTIEQAGENLIPSIGEAAKGIYSAVRHPVDTAGTLLKIGKGLASKVDGLAGEKQDPEQKAKDEQLVDALANSYKEKYGSIDGFKKYLAKDPAGLLFDASTVLSGGGGLAAKLPGVIGRAGEVAGAVGKAVNPLNPMGVVSDTVKAVTSPAAALDKAGNVVPKVDALIKKVTNGTMSGADLMDPDVKAAFAATIAKKGLSEESVKEGLLRSMNLKAPTQSVTGRSVPLAAKEATAAAVEHNNDALDKHASNLGGTPSTSELGEALDQAHTRSYNNASASYDKIRNIQGSFGPLHPNNGSLGELGNTIDTTLTKSGLPNDLQALRATGYTQTAASIKLLQSYWGSGKSLMYGPGGQVDSREILAMRKALNNLKASANGSDAKGVNDVINSFDQHLQSESALGKFKDANGRPVYGLGQQINTANAAYKAHFNAFDQSANPAMRGAINQLKDKQTFSPTGQRLPSGDIDRYSTAQEALGRQLLHQTKGANTYNQLKTALGGNSAPIDNFVKSMVLNGDKPIKGVGKLLNNPNSVVTKAFAGSPDDLARARHIQAARDITNTKPTPGKSSSLKSILGGFAAKGASSVAGYETMGLPGLVAGPLMEHGVEKLSESRAAKSALAGAKNTSSLPARMAKKTIQSLTSPVGLAAGHYKDEAQKVNDSIPRASGGKVDHEAMVTRLVNKWKQAKKATNDTTKPLLNVPDATIVRALDIAQEHI